MKKLIIIFISFFSVNMLANEINPHTDMSRLTNETLLLTVVKDIHIPPPLMSLYSSLIAFSKGNIINSRFLSGFVSSWSKDQRCEIFINTPMLTPGVIKKGTVYKVVMEYGGPSHIVFNAKTVSNNKQGSTLGRFAILCSKGDIENANSWYTEHVKIKSYYIYEFINEFGGSLILSGKTLNKDQFNRYSDTAENNTQAYPESTSPMISEIIFKKRLLLPIQEAIGFNRIHNNKYFFRKGLYLERGPAKAYYDLPHEQEDIMCAIIFKRSLEKELIIKSGFSFKPKRSYIIGSSILLEGGGYDEEPNSKIQYIRCDNLRRDAGKGFQMTKDLVTQAFGVDRVIVRGPVK